MSLSGTTIQRDSNGGDAATPQTADSEAIIEIVDGILFPAAEDAPRIIRVRCRKLCDEGQSFHRPWLEQYIGSGFRDSRLVGHVPGKGNLRPNLRVYFRDTFLHDGSPINSCIRPLTKGESDFPWAGNIVLLKEGWGELYMNASMTDVQDLVTYFKGYAKSGEGIAREMSLV